MDLFNGVGHAPSALTDQDIQSGTPTADDLMNLPDWLRDEFTSSLGKAAQAQAQELIRRAPVTLRVNSAKTDRAALQARLAQDGIASAPNALSDTALTVTNGARQLTRTSAFEDGLFEMQDAASQAVVATLPIVPGQTVLDFCAGGGGKSLAMAARGADVSAHDVSASRMKPIAERAARADVSIATVSAQENLAGVQFDLVLVDAPCSGSGSWRRAPDAKWRLTPERLRELVDLQGEILEQAAAYVRPGGILAYATCSVLRAENDARADAFAASPDWRALDRNSWPISAEGDGFFLALFARG